MHLLLPLLLIASHAVTQVTLTQLDESRTEGPLVQWTDGSLRLSDNPSTTVAIDDLLRLEVQTVGSSRPRVSPSIEVELVDGSRLSAADFASQNGACSLSRLADDLPDVQAPLAAVRSVRLMAIDDEPASAEYAAQLNTQWTEITHQNLAADAIVILKRGVNSLDYVEGVLGDVGPTHVQFSLDGQQLEVSRDKVYGIVYFRSDEVDRGRPTGPVVHGPTFKIHASRVGWSDDRFEVSHSLLGSLTLPASAVESIDFSAGRLVYLSDLEPQSVKWTPPLGASRSLPLFGGLARDRGFYSPTIDIEHPANSLTPDRSTSAGLPHVQRMTKGLAVRTNLEVRYQLPGGYQWFRGVAAVAPGIRPASPIELQVVGDRQVLASHTLTAGDEPIELQCDVTGVSELSLLVRSKASGGTGSVEALLGASDLLNLGGARITQ